MIAIALITVLFFLDKSLAGIENEILIRDLSLTEIGRDRRALSDLYNSLKSAINPNLYTQSCITSACSSDYNASSCVARCQEDIPDFNILFNSVQTCLSRDPCGGSLGLWNLGSINIPIAIAGFNGQCILQGNMVSVTGGNKFKQTSKRQYPKYPVYQANQVIVLTYNGFSINCIAWDDTCPQNSQQNNNPGNSGNGLSSLGGLLNTVLCLVDNLLKLGIFNCPGSRVQSSPSIQSCCTNLTNSFKANVTVVQTNKISYLDEWYSIGQSQTLKDLRSYFMSSSTVSLSSGVPSKYQSTLKTAISDEFSTISLIDAIANNYYSIFLIAVASLYGQCPNC